MAESAVSFCAVIRLATGQDSDFDEASLPSAQRPGMKRDGAKRRIVGINAVTPESICWMALRIKIETLSRLVPICCQQSGVGQRSKSAPDEIKAGVPAG